ncbi:MAG: hypothetical protein AAGA73_11970 [Pseudomonadota bacterium]
MLNELKIDRVVAPGISGGTPYGLVLTWAMPERVRFVAIMQPHASS